MDKLPKDTVDLRDGDLRENLFRLIQDDSAELKGIDYTKDVEPWLGDRMGVSVSAPAARGKDPVVAVAIQVKDKELARQGLDRLKAAVSAPTAGKAEYFFHGDYAVFTQAGELATVKGAVNDSPLSENATFAKDMDDLGEQGIMSAWADLGGAAAQFDRAGALKGLNGVVGSGPASRLGSSVEELKDSGRTAMALRFDQSYVELGGITRGQSALRKDQGAGASAQQQLDELEAHYGISLPADLKTLLGRNLVLAAPDQDLEHISSPDELRVGARITTDAVRVESAVGKLQKIAQDQGSPFPVSHKAEGDQFFLATNDGYLDQISAEGDLGGREAFTLALPEAAGAQYAVYVDLDRIEHRYLNQIKDAAARELVTAFRSFGLTARATADGEGAFSVRLVSN